MIILCTFFQAILVFIDYSFTNKISLFQLIIIIFIVYATTIGSSDIQRLDQFLQKKFKKTRTTFSENIYVYTKYRRKLFLIHTTTFLTIHLVWFLIDLNINKDLYNIKLLVFNEPFFTLPLFFKSNFFNIISYLWIIIYSFDLCTTLIYTTWQMRNK